MHVGVSSQDRVLELFLEGDAIVLKHGLRSCSSECACLVHRGHNIVGTDERVLGHAESSPSLVHEFHPLVLLIPLFVLLSINSVRGQKSLFFDHLLLHSVRQVINLAQKSLVVKALEVVILKIGSQPWHLEDGFHSLELICHRVHICMNLLEDRLPDVEFCLRQASKSLVCQLQLLGLLLEIVIELSLDADVRLLLLLKLSRELLNLVIQIVDGLHVSLRVLHKLRHNLV